MSNHEHVALSFVTTSYNDGAYMLPNVKRVISVLKHLRYEFEIVFVDDKSSDDSVQRIEEFIRSNPGVRFQFLKHEVNKGRGRTVSDGIHAAKGLYAGYI